MAEQKKKPNKDAFLREDIMKARDRDAERIRQEMQQESESDRQLRLYRESNVKNLG